MIESIPQWTKIVVDGTLGHGWHTKAILETYPEISSVLGIDEDAIMLEKANKQLSSQANRVIFEQWSYAQTDILLKKHNLKNADYILLDIGVNMEHFKDGSRGFSTNVDAPLDMRFNSNTEVNAYHIINQYPAHQLAKVFITYADFAERQAEKIAEHIVHKRKEKEIKTTQELKNIFHDLWMGMKPIAVLFQALRIETNKEIDNLKLFLSKIDGVLSPWWRCAIISYHSIEDKTVKEKYKELVETGKYKLVSKKAIIPDYKEIEKNKAARSAKLRIIEKL